jgi:hypothetical protein
VSFNLLPFHIYVPLQGDRRGILGIISHFSSCVWLCRAAKGAGVLRWRSTRPIVDQSVRKADLKVSCQGDGVRGSPLSRDLLTPPGERLTHLLLTQRFGAGPRDSITPEG